MHHKVLMRVVQCTGNARCDFSDHFERQHHTGIEHLAQRFPFQIFHRDISDIAGFAHVINGDNIGMVQTACRLGFAVKPLLELGAFFV